MKFGEILQGSSNKLINLKLLPVPLMPPLRLQPVSMASKPNLAIWALAVNPVMKNIKKINFLSPIVFMRNKKRQCSMTAFFIGLINFDKIVIDIKRGQW